MSDMSVNDLNRVFEENFAPWVHELDLSVTESDATGVTMTMQPGERLNRQGGIVSGQALMAAADSAMVLAVISANSGCIVCSTVDMNTSFLKPATNVALQVTATVIRLGKSIAFTRAEIISSKDNKAVLSATGTYALPTGR